MRGGPITTAAALLGAATAGPETGPDELVDIWPLLIQVGWFLLGFLAVVVVGRLFAEPVVARVVRRRNRENPTIQHAVVLYFRLVVVLIAALVGATVAGYGRFLGDSALVISAVALAVGIAAREVMGSLVSGMALVLDPEFNVGDFIQWEGGEGVVQSIALRVTRVETLDGELVTIPNTILTAHGITRPYGRGNHRIVHELGVDDEEDLGTVLAELEAAADDLDRILADPAPAAYVEDLDDSTVVVRVYYWIDAPDPTAVLAARSAYVRAARDRLADAGVTVSPAPQHALEGEIAVREAGDDGRPDRSSGS